MSKEELISALLLLGFTDKGRHEDGHHDFDLYDPEHVGLLVCYVRFLRGWCIVSGKKSCKLDGSDMERLWPPHSDPAQPYPWKDVLDTTVRYLEKFREVNHDRR